MAAPTQMLPSWLTLATTVVTAPDGAVTTSLVTLQLPLTYYGPSVSACLYPTLLHETRPYSYPAIFTGRLAFNCTTSDKAISV